MAIIAVTRIEGTPDSGNIYYQQNTAEEFTQQTTPPGVTGARTRPILLKYQSRVYIYGMFSTPMVITETRRNWSQGIPPPPAAPGLATGSSSGGSSGFAIGYITFLEKDAGKVIHESNPSTPTDTIELHGEGRVWSGLPTTALNPRVTHIRGYVSMDGSLPAKAWERQIGVTSVSENVPTLFLGERLPVIIGLDSELDLDPYARCVPPNCRFAEVYHDAMWLAGDNDHPTRVYYSKLFEPESFNTVDRDRGWFETLDGERVTGLKRWGDILLVGCLRACYAIQGFSSGDYQMIKLSNYYGVVSHHSMVLVGPDSDLWAAGQEGVWMYNGSFHDLMEDDLRNYWRDDYMTNPLFYEDSFAAEDRYERTYQLVIPQENSTTFKYIGHWLPVVKGGQPPWWVWDRRNRKDSAIGSIVPADDNHFGELLTGSCDGFIRKENIQSNADDDGDTYGKAMTVTTKHFFFGDQSGDFAHGRNYTDFDVFLRNPTVAVTISAYAGDDSANQASEAQWSQVVPASAVTTPRAKVALTSSHIGPVAEINGKGITLKFTASSPTGVGLRGFSIYFTLGDQERPFS